ncbi:MAG: hypothetical protein V7603_829 [Micromonosporaceae bacterium]
MKGMMRSTLLAMGVVTLALALSAPAMADPGPHVVQPPGSIVLRGPAIGAVPALSASATAGPLTAGQRIKNADGDTTGKCLDLQGAGAGPFAQMWQCNGGAQQNWSYHGRPDIANGVYEIVSRFPSATPQCLAGNPTAQGIQVYVLQCDESRSVTNMLWEVNPIGSWNQWILVIASPGNPSFCLDVRDNGKSNVVQVWPCNISDPATRGNQMWQLF